LTKSEQVGIYRNRKRFRSESLLVVNSYWWGRGVGDGGLVDLNDFRSHLSRYHIMTYIVLYVMLFQDYAILAGTCSSFGFSVAGCVIGSLLTQSHYHCHYNDVVATSH
jgi:hypothetical protein